jgi:hypothetical protein
LGRLRAFREGGAEVKIPLETADRKSGALRSFQYCRKRQPLDGEPVPTKSIVTGSLRYIVTVQVAVEVLIVAVPRPVEPTV